MAKQFSLEELAQLTSSELVGNPTVLISNVDNLKSAGESDASFLANPRYNEEMKQSQAGVICIDNKTEIVEGKNFLICESPSRTFQIIAEKLLASQNHHSGFEGVHASAVIHDSAQIAENVTIGPHVVIDQNVQIGEGTKIIASVSVGPGVIIGKECTLYPGSVVRELCTLGDRVILQPGAIIGSCGFGYTPDPKTGKHTKLEQLGTVILGDDVEIGANSTIDRARFKTTLIKKGTKIDNLVQIAHNVELGENNIIVSQSGIAGSSKLGNNVCLGGQSGVVGHVSITDNVIVATRGGVSKSIKQPGIYRGGPVAPLREYNKREVYLRNIETYVQEIKKLKKRIELLENKDS